jgi:hypothetical protein
MAKAFECPQVIENKAQKTQGAIFLAREQAANRPQQ